jgi:uncharacterized membrane protein
VARKTLKGKNEFAIFILLAIASLVCVSLVAARNVYTGNADYRFLIWNLLLAWIPFGAAAAAHAFAGAGRRALYAVIVACALVWLLFFPNAPYILTDFLHLGTITDSAPKWFDVLLIMWFAWTGLLLGVVSLNLMQQLVRRILGRIVAWVFVVLAAVAGSIGIYIGRFLGWNSWDLFRKPGSLTAQLFDRAGDPSGLQLIGFCLLFALLFLFVYLTLYLFGMLSAESFGRGGGAPSGEDAAL